MLQLGSFSLNMTEQNWFCKGLFGKESHLTLQDYLQEEFSRDKQCEQ